MQRLMVLEDTSAPHLRSLENSVCSGGRQETGYHVCRRTSTVSLGTQTVGVPDYDRIYSGRLMCRLAEATRAWYHAHAFLDVLLVRVTRSIFKSSLQR